MSWKYILFDLDGTLTDSSEGILNCVKYALESVGAKIPGREELLQFIGPPLMDGFQTITGMDYEEAYEATLKYRERYSVIGLFENTPYENISLVLSRLKSQGKVLAVATSKPERYTVRILQHFNLAKYFDAVVGSTMDATRNQKSEIIQEVFRRLHISGQEKEQVIMVGDRKHDILGAKECGIASLGVYYGFASLGELEEAGADHVVWNVDEIMQVLGEDEEQKKEDGEKKKVRLSQIEYKRVNFQEMERRLLLLTKRQRDAESLKEQLKLHLEYYQIQDRVATMSVLAAFRHSIDTSDTYYDGENDYYDEMMPLFEVKDIEYKNALYESPFQQGLKRAIGEVTFKNIELLRRAYSEDIVELRQEENTLVSEYEKLLASARFDWEQDTLSMSELGKYQMSSQRRIRRRAWQQLQDFMTDHGDAWNRIYDALVKNRTLQAKQLGYEDYVQLGYDRMRRNCYGKEQVRAFREQIKEHWVPFVSKLQEKRRARLGVEQLQMIDNGVYFAEGNPMPLGEPEKILANGLSMYQELSKETGEFMEQVMEREMFDVMSRPGKQQGGYMEFLPEPRMPLIFANFNGTSGDVDVITHECGHAFQAWVAAGDEIREHWDITMETAETHSMSMEFFTNPWMELFFGEDADRFRRMQLEDAICFIPYGCMVDEFQEIIYEYPNLSPTQRHEVWKRLEGQYRPHLDLHGMPFFEKGGYWQKQHHIYSDPFYYIDYCLAEICALQYKVLMQQDYQKAWQSYLKLCRLSASGYFTDMIREVGLKSPFEEDCVEELAHQLGEYMLMFGE